MAPVQAGTSMTERRPKRRWRGAHRLAGLGRGDPALAGTESASVATMNVARFCASRPLLFHYTTPNGVDRLRRVGLWCAEDLLRAYGVAPDRLERLVTFPRFEPEEFDDPVHGPARLSHQRPMLTTRTLQPHVNLVRSLELTGTTLGDFCRMLARRVFLFAEQYSPTTRRAPNGFVRRVLHDGDLFEVALSTERLLALCAQHGLTLELSAHNAGSAPREVRPKGRITWRAIEEFDRGVSDIHEAVVEGSLPPLDDVIQHVRQVEA